MDRTFLGTGWKFPVIPTRTGALALSSEEAKIQQSIWIILSTAPGERLMNPRFGCGIHDLVFSPNSVNARDNVGQQVRRALVTFEPRIQLLEVNVDAGPGEPAKMLIRISYRIRSSNVIQNMVYPFFVREGKGA
jgi:Bacteriophage baseplate protein W